MLQKTNSGLGRTLFASLVAAVLPVLDVGATGVVPTPAVADPVALYGGSIEFDVFREGTKVGFHRTRFDADGAELSVTSTFELRIDVLFFTAYRYAYRSQARWRQGRLLTLTAEVSDDGKTSSLAVRRDGRHLIVRNGQAVDRVAAPMFPTNHWNAAVLAETKVLNTLTGRVNRVRIEPRGDEAVATERGDVKATRYAYTGELATEVWYDNAGRWVKMRFKGTDGSTIEYVCQRCQGGNIGRPR